MCAQEEDLVLEPKKENPMWFIRTELQHLQRTFCFLGVIQRSCLVRRSLYLRNPNGNQCLQLHGGYGYLADYGIEKLVRDLRVHEILEGTNEIMRLIVARQMLADT